MKEATSRESLLEKLIGEMEELIVELREEGDDPERVAYLEAEIGKLRSTLRGALRSDPTESDG